MKKTDIGTWKTAVVLIGQLAAVLVFLWLLLGRYHR